MDVLALTDEQRRVIAEEALDHGQMLDMAFAAGAEAARGEMEGMWLNAFACISPSDEFATAVGRALIKTCKIPGRTVVRVSIT